MLTLTLKLTLFLSVIKIAAADFGSVESISDITNPIVNLGYAKYQGVVNSNTGNTEFLGVRFARAPVQELRWDAPQAPLSVSDNEVVLADTLPVRCIGTSSPGLGDFSPFVENKFSARKVARERRDVIDPPGMSEDCLFLK